MAKPGRQSFEKRLREKKKKEKRQEKLDKRAERKAEKESGDIPDDMIADVSSIVFIPGEDTEDTTKTVADEEKSIAEEVIQEPEEGSVDPAPAESLQKEKSTQTIEAESS